MPAEAGAPFAKLTKREEPGAPATDEAKPQTKNISLSNMPETDQTSHPLKNWIVCQIGAREDYTVPRALHQAECLDQLLTDVWARPDGLAGRMISKNSMFQRWHAELEHARVWAPNSASFWFEALARSHSSYPSWSTILRRNRRFQKACVHHLERHVPADPSAAKTVFAFSYAARDIFKLAKARGWTTVLGQIDPGPHEESLVAAEHQHYPDSGSTWRPAPPEYWNHWREEVELADHIVVNSPWARDGLLAAGVDAAKIRIVPLYCARSADLQSAHGNDTSRHRPGGLKSALHARKPNDNHTAQRLDQQAPTTDNRQRTTDSLLQVLFIGRVSLRKGIARLIEAMRLLRDQPVELHIYGTLSVSTDMWRDLPKVRWEGSVKHSRIYQVYEAADVFILPTVSDGFARTQLESLACGTPVIASRNCGNVIIPGVNGFLLEHNTPEEIAGLLSSLAADHAPLRHCDTTRLPAEMPRSMEAFAAELLKVNG